MNQMEMALITFLGAMAVPALCHADDDLLMSGNTTMLCKTEASLRVVTAMPGFGQVLPSAHIPDDCVGVPARTKLTLLETSKTHVRVRLVSRPIASKAVPIAPFRPTEITHGITSDTYVGLGTFPKGTVPVIVPPVPPAQISDDTDWWTSTLMVAKYAPIVVLHAQCETVPGRTFRDIFTNDTVFAVDNVKVESDQNNICSAFLRTDHRAAYKINWTTMPNKDGDIMWKITSMFTIRTPEYEVYLD